MAEMSKHFTKGTDTMKQVWIFLLMLPLFCIGDTEENKADPKPILEHNPEYSAPPADRIKQDAKAGSSAENTASPDVQLQVKTEVPEEPVKHFTRQVYRQKPPLGVTSLSNEPVSSRVVYNPDSEKAANQRPVFSRVEVSDNSAQLALWRAKHPPVRTTLPRVTNFRPASSYSSCRRSSGYRTICRRKKSSSCRTAKTCSSCRRSSCSSR